jgi:predicted DNA-binding transcriptional regulator YafY
MGRPEAPGTGGHDFELALLGELAHLGRIDHAENPKGHCGQFQSSTRNNDWAMVDSSGRLLRLLGLLQRRAAWSGTDLAERLEIDTRTVRRDVEKLRVLGYQIAGTPGAGGGYRLGGGTEVPPLLFEDDEAMAVAVVLGVSATAAVPGIERGALAALTKLDRLLPPRLRVQLTALRAATVPLVSPTELLPIESLVLLAQACDSHQLAMFSYRASSGLETQRRVEPHRLVATDRRWYLVAYDLERDDWRTFRVDRVSALEVRGHTFVPRPLADPARMVAEGIATAPYAHRAVVILNSPLEDVARLVTPHTGVLQDLGERTKVELGYDDLDWVAGYLVGLGLEFEVLEPAPLREHIGVLAERLGRSHRSERAMPAS